MVLPAHLLQVTVEQHEQLETDGGEEGGEEEKMLICVSSQHRHLRRFRTTDLQNL